MKRYLIGGLTVATILQGSSCLWGSGPGTTAADILKIPLGARAIGMGEAYTAMADDVSSLYWNPAGLALMRERQASFMYSQMIQNMTYQNANVGIPLENGAIGGSLSYLNYGSIAGFDNNGTATGNQTAYSGVGTLGGAWLGDQWSAGANLKVIQEKLADVKANGAALDLGGNIIYPKPILGGTVRFGAAVRNIGPGIAFEQQKDPLPMDYRIGIAAVQMLDRKLNVALDYSKPKDDSSSVSGGAEYWVIPFLALRAGYVINHTEGSGIRAGLGLRIKGVSFDYSYSGQGDLGMSHRYELSFRFGEPRPILTAEERKIFQQAKAAMRQNRFEQAVLLLDSLIELEPRFKPARRYINIAMAKLETQQGQALARQGKMYQPGGDGGVRKPALPEMDDMEQLLNLGAPHPTKGQPEKKTPAATVGGK